MIYIKQKNIQSLSEIYIIFLSKDIIEYLITLFKTAWIELS